MYADKLYERMAYGIILRWHDSGLYMKSVNPTNVLDVGLSFGTAIVWEEFFAIQYNTFNITW